MRSVKEIIESGAWDEEAWQREVEAYREKERAIEEAPSELQQSWRRLGLDKEEEMSDDRASEKLKEIESLRASQSLRKLQKSWRELGIDTTKTQIQAQPIKQMTDTEKKLVESWEKLGLL